MILIVLVLAAFLRLYKIDQYMTFLGDEGRDAIIVKDMLVNYHIPAIGPTTSVGNIYSGPLYYYMMGISMVGTLSPVAAAVMNALIGVATVFLIYWLTKKLFDEISGLIAAFLYSISPVAIIYSRSSWNPNPVPFFTLLSFISFYKFHETRNYKWLWLVGLFVAAAVQMHFICLVLVGIFGVLWILEYLQDKKQSSNLIRGGLGAIVSFLILFIPWFLFEIKHGYPNIKGLFNLFFGSNAAIGSGNIIFRVWDVLNKLIGDYLGGSDSLVTTAVLFLLGAILFRLVKSKKVILYREYINYLLIFFWFILGVLGISLFKGNIYDHYLGFVSPTIYILLGSVWYYFMKIPRLFNLSKKIFPILAILIGIGLSYINLSNSPLLYSPNRQLQRTQEITKYVINETGGKDFNFALLAKNNYDSAYQFYFDIFGKKPKVVPMEKTSQLFVVCEDSPCQPINNPKYEIAAFGMSKVESVKDFEGAKVYKLVANPSGKPS